MSPDGLTRAELETRIEQIQRFIRMELAEMRAETKLSQDHQDEEWNKGIRALRDDLRIGSETLRSDIQKMLQDFVTKEVFAARLTPVQSIAYGLIVLLATLMTGTLAAVLYGR